MFEVICDNVPVMFTQLFRRALAKVHVDHFWKMLFSSFKLYMRQRNDLFTKQINIFSSIFKSRLMGLKTPEKIFDNG